MISIEELLKPVSDDKPCGEDLSYDPGFQELETLMKGKPETQFSQAEPPDWKKVRSRCVELMKRSKDLRLVTVLASASLKTDGPVDFRDALKVMKGMLEQYWEQLYPLLDPEDNNDPTGRVNIIAGMALPVGNFGDPLQMLQHLREAPLTNSVQMGRFSLADIQNAGSGGGRKEGESNASTSQVDAAFLDTPEDELQKVHQALTESAALIEGIDRWLTEKVGAGSAADLNPLVHEIVEVARQVVPYLAVAPEAVAEPGEGGGAVAGGGVPAQAIAGEITGRQDVIKMIDKICDYYKKVEPASPVPLLLRRARRMVDMDFMEIMKDMTPDAIPVVRNISGDRE